MDEWDGNNERVGRVNNPKTTLSGYIGFIGTIIVGMSALLPPRYGHYAMLVGIALSGAANSLGNVVSQDGSN